MSHFYPTERLARTDYNFSQDQSGILLPHTPPAAAAITFQTASPAPLPPRRATFSLNNEAVFTLLVDQTPRRIALLLPPEATRPHKGVLVQVETATATAPGDPRDLGLLFTGIHIHSFEQNRPFWHYPSVFAIQCIVFTILIVSGASLVFAGISLVSLSSVLLVNQRLFILLCMLVIPAALLYRQLPYSDIRERLKQKHLLFGDPYLTIVLTVCIVYTIVLSWYSIINHNLFGTNVYDLGIFDQALWLISRGEIPYITANGRHILGDHAAFILYPLAGLYTIYPDVRVLLVVQTMVISLGAIPLYLIARDQHERFLGTLISIVYLVHPATHNMNLIDFHTDPFAGTAFLFALWAITRRNWWLLAFCCSIILIAKENFATTTAFIGLWLLIQREWRVGLFILIGSVCWLFFTTRIVVPHFSSQQQSVFIDRFAHYGGSLSEILSTFITQPHVIIQDVFNDHNRNYIWQLFIPFALLPLVYPRYLVLAIPALSLNLLSNFAAQQTLIFHYNALITPILALASLQAIIFIKKKSPYKKVILACCIIGIFGGSFYLHTTVYIRLYHIHEAIDQHSHRADSYQSVLSFIPPDAPVSTQMMFQTHLAHREQAYMFPNPFSSVVFYDPQGLPYTPLVDYIMYDTRRPDSIYMLAEQQLQILAALQQKGLYEPVIALDGIVLLQRTDRVLPASCFGTDWNMSVINDRSYAVAPQV